MRTVKDGELATRGDWSDDLEVTGVERGGTWSGLECEKEVTVEPGGSVGHMGHFECFGDVMIIFWWCEGKGGNGRKEGTMQNVPKCGA